MHQRRSRPALYVAASSTTVAALIIALASTPAPAMGVPAEDDSSACRVLEAETASEAASLAEECGDRVEVLAERTPWETSYVAETGKSVLEVSVYPTRTHVNGEWEAVDTTIEKSARKGVAMDVAAPVLDMQLNGGDTSTPKPLGVIESNGHIFKVWFPLPLPTPQVEGDQATYELAEGVRVVTYVSPDGTGFTPVVELDDRDAAQWFRTSLERARAERGLPGTGFDIPLRFELSSGLSPLAMADGTVRITDTGNNIVFQAPAAFMWDSSGALPVDPTLPGTDPTSTIEGDRAEWAWPGDVVAQMPVRIEGSSMVLSPDATILTSTETSWPVHIDPGFSGQGAADWTMLRTGGYTSSMYRFTNLSASYPGGGVGRCIGTASCGVSSYTARLVWQFAGLDSIAALNASDVDSATFSVYGISSYNCNAATTELWHTGGINSSSTWANVPFHSLQTSNTSANRDGCAQGPGWRDFGITGALQWTAANNYNQITFGLKAADENSMAGWKRFGNDAQLSVTYNRPPNPPTNVKLSNPSVACVSGAGRPIINNSTPTISGTPSDPDGGTVYPSFQVYNVSSGAQVWAAGPGAGVASGSGVSATVSPALSDGIPYGYRLNSHDGAKWSGWSTSVCEFIVDTVKPLPPTVAAATSGAAVYDAGKERGGVGLAGTFTLNRGTSADVTQLQYQFAAGAWLTATPNGSGIATVSYTPTTAGPVTLKVTARDAAGNVSNPTTYIFDVAAPKQGSRWKLDEGTGSTAADSGASAPAKPLTITGAGWVPGPETAFGGRPDDRALQFNDSSAFATSAPAVSSTGAFSVSARVWLNSAAVGGAGSYTAVSQDGVSQSEFTLGYEPACTAGQGCWSFRMPNSDSAASSVAAARSATAAVGDRWVQLFGVYDPAAAGGAKVRLWVCDVGTPDDPGDGEPATYQAARTATAWTSGGAFTVGRGKSAGQPAAAWPGIIDQVQVFNGAVVDRDIVVRECVAAAGAGE